MRIKRLHASFLVTIGSYNNERVGFSVELEDGDSIDSVVDSLRQKAIGAIGPTAQELYDKRRQQNYECDILEAKLIKLRKEWDATALFLKTQGLNPEAPSMPQFQNLLNAVTVESVVMDDDDDEDDDEDQQHWE